MKDLQLNLFSKQLLHKKYLIGIIIMFSALSGCSYLLGDNLILQNNTRYPITDVVISAEGEEVWRGSVKAREELDLNFLVPKEGMLEISGEWKGKEVNSGDSWSYASPAVSNQHKIELRDDGRFYDFEY